MIHLLRTRLYLTFFLIIPSNLLAAFAAPCEARSQPELIFTQELLPKLSPQDARLLLNLIYWSYQRSRHTCILQEKALTSLAAHWNAWHTCAERRLDPSAIIPQEKVGLETSCKPFSEACNRFHTTHTTYIQVVAVATNQSSYRQHDTFAFVETLRSTARILVLSELWDHFGEMRAHLEKQLDDHQELWRTQVPSTIDMAFYQAKSAEDKGILDAFAQMAALSFNHFDQIFTSKNDQLFTHFITMQSLFTDLWKIIEETRAEFYRSYFTLVRNGMIERNFPQESFLNLFNQDGLLTPGQQTFSLTISS